MNDFEKYKSEAQEKWDNTSAYKEHEEKTKHYSKDKWNSLGAEMDDIFGEFAVCMKNGTETDSAEVQVLVKKLQSYISENFYSCTDEILAGLGRMYVADERFTNNINKHSDGTSQYVSEAIEVYCRK